MEIMRAMVTWMSCPAISFDAFELPFFATESSSHEDEEESDAIDVKSFKRLLPRNAIFVGRISDEVSNWTSWKVDDRFYVIPWEGPEFDWALFRISWDDNWGHYEWTADARIKGETDPSEAARQMARGLFARWGIDLSGNSSRPYRRFLERIGRPGRPKSNDARQGS